MLLAKHEAVIVVLVFNYSTRRMEELTDPELIRQNVKCDRKVSLYGYVRGTHLQHNSRVHIIGNLMVLKNYSCQEYA